MYFEKGLQVITTCPFRASSSPELIKISQMSFSAGIDPKTRGGCILDRGCILDIFIYYFMFIILILFDFSTSHRWWCCCSSPPSSFSFFPFPYSSSSSSFLSFLLFFLLLCFSSQFLKFIFLKIRILITLGNNHF